MPLDVSCQVTGCRRRLKKRLPITVLSSSAAASYVVAEHQTRESHLGLNGPASDIIARSRAISLSDEIISRFRRPMAPGETRENIAFGEQLDHEISG